MRYSQFFSPQPLPTSISTSSLDSKRFGMNIGRLELGVISDDHTPEAIRDLILASGLDLAIVRYPSTCVDWFARLFHPDYRLIHADTLMYYARDLLADDAVHTPPNNWSALHAQPSDHPRIEALVRRIFPGYTNHYRANPYLPERSSLDGYVEWACAYTGRDDRACLLLADQNDDIGMVTVDINAHVAEIALIGTSPTARGRGVAAELMRQAQAWAFAQGATSLVISTQAQNTAVQRVWVRLGYQPTHALTTVHALMQESLA